MSTEFHASVQAKLVRPGASSSKPQTRWLSHCCTFPSTSLASLRAHTSHCSYSKWRSSCPYSSSVVGTDTKTDLRMLQAAGTFQLCFGISTQILQMKKQGRDFLRTDRQARRQMTLLTAARCLWQYLMAGPAPCLFACPLFCSRTVNSWEPDRHPAQVHML